MTDTVKTTATTEEYLEIIYMMAAEGRVVKGARLAEIIGVSRPTVTATLQRMTRDGLIRQNAKKEVELTEKGYTVADTLQRRHRIIERWLTDVLQFDWAKSDAESHRLEHVFSDEVIERLNELLGRPETCPHGNPIPGNQRDGKKPTAFPLSQAAEGDRVRVARISEYAENTGNLLSHLGERGLRPGEEFNVTDISPLNQALTLHGNDKHFSLSSQIADAVWVTKFQE
jgi:DtxR family transcriptional regulator, Mn-dependent transcriptional regulator